MVELWSEIIINPIPITIMIVVVCGHLAKMLKQGQSNLELNSVSGLQMVTYIGYIKAQSSHCIRAP